MGERLSFEDRVRRIDCVLVYEDITLNNEDYRARFIRELEEIGLELEPYTPVSKFNSYFDVYKLTRYI